MSDNYGAYCEECGIREPSCCGLCTVCVSSQKAEIATLREQIDKAFAAHPNLDLDIAALQESEK